MRELSSIHLVIEGEPAFLGRIKSAVIVAAAEVVGEDIATADHAVRVQLARRVLVLREDGLYAKVMLQIALATTPALDGELSDVTDAAVLNFVRGRFTSVAALSSAA